MRLQTIFFVFVGSLLCGIGLGTWGESSEIDLPVSLSVPDTIQDERVLWKGPLEQRRETRRVGYSPFLAFIRRPEWRSQLVTDPPVDPLRVPILTIGQPEVIPLPQIYPPEKMPLVMQTQLKEADFYLVHLFCSFRPIPGESYVGWARFHVFLLPDASGRQPIAYDIFPLEITQEVKRYSKLTMAPTLKIQSVEVDVGSAEVGKDYLELQPIIVGAGVGEATPTWDFKTTAGIEGVEGAKLMLLLVKAPKGMRLGKAQLDLTAQVHVKGAWTDWIPFLAPSEARREYLILQLWP